jgi:predicted nucleotidyltransferase
MDKLLNQLIEKLQKAYGDALVSVVLYGSAVTGDHHAKFSDLNVLCVLSQVTPRELAAGEPVFRWWREKGSPSPLLLTERELNTSTDCFAIEFRDIKRHSRVLHGKDVITDLALDDSFYRAQVEHDLRAKLLRLRQKACGTLSDADSMRRLLLDSVSTFCALFRHALVLHGVAAPATKREVVAASKEAFALDPAVFETLLDVREGRRKARDMDPAKLLGPYLDAISTVIEAVDRLDK